MENWHKRLVEIREKHLLKQKDVADAIGKDVTRVSRYERGKGSKHMPAFMKQGLKSIFTPEEIQYIETGDKASMVQSGNGHVMVRGNKNTVAGGDIGGHGSVEERKRPAYGANGSDTVSMPYYPETYASAGGGAYPYLEGSAPMSFSKTFLQTFLGVSMSGGMHIINVTGDSMEPTLHDGSLIVVNPVENEGEMIRDGGIYVIMCDNTILVKRVLVDPIQNVYTLRSDNREGNDDIRIDGMSFKGENACRFIGRVVGSFDKV